MPEVSRFYGIVVKIFYGDHPPPYFHVEYAEHKARLEIYTLEVIDGRLPSRAMGLVLEWASAHRSELLDCWKRSQEGKAPGKIAPLS